ncbi:MAG: gfo/Idh/MocA family oxidoreductase [Chloroflexi bacterium]|nr:MAG: gfo/Idh/MocA family oxidoreductase [Chloroflexota bacterium]
MTALAIQTTPRLPQVPRPIIMIGAGGIVNDAHLPAYKKAGFPVVGIFDLNRQRAAQTAAAFNIPQVFDSLESAVASAPPNAVFDIATPASALPDILPQLPDNAAVLFQKPMGENLAQARRIYTICRQKNLTAAVNFQLRFAPFVIAARSLIEQGAIGSVHDMEVRVTVYTPWHLWKFLEQVEYVEITYHSIHYLDLIRSFLGEPGGVYAKTTRHPATTNIDSTASNIILDYGPTIRAAISTNHNHQFGLTHQESFIKWEGTKGAIKAKMGLLMNYPTGVPDVFEYCILEEGTEPQWQTLSIEGSWFPDGFIGTMSSLQCFVEGSADVLPTSVEDVINTMILVDAARRSNETGAVPVTVPATGK